jgi:hypothetical protein
MKLVAYVISELLLVTGGGSFFFGDKALEVWKVNFGLGESAGISCGILLIVAGGAMRSALSKSSKPQRGYESSQ